MILSKKNDFCPRRKILSKKEDLTNFKVCKKLISEEVGNEPSQLVALLIKDRSSTSGHCDPPLWLRGEKPEPWAAGGEWQWLSEHKEELCNGAAPSLPPVEGTKAMTPDCHDQ